MGFLQRRILIRSADRFQGSNTTFTVHIQSPIQKLRHSEWVSSTVDGLVLIDKIPAASLTSGGCYYWRNVKAGINGYYSPFGEAPYSVAAFSTLQISILNSDGTPSTTTTPVEIELDLYCDDEL
ncbi:MAG: hypothetical protein EBZ69_01460 [Alphaproteobacteria bacterium]|nr:hypothetical protein [Alphaproteobacteria bacterium]